MSAIVGNMPSSRNWAGVAWNGSVFCAVAGGTNIAATSPDGINWTAQTLPSSAQWSDIASSGTVFCATKSNAAVIGEIFAYSYDGITWVKSNSVDTTFYSRGIAYGTGVFCSADSLGTRVYRSSNGITFSSGTLPGHTYWNRIAWSGSLFCVNVLDTAVNYAATSPDGITWSYTTLPITEQWSGIAGGNGKICILPQTSSATQCVVSNNGTDWQVGTLPPALWRHIVWTGSAFCALPATGSNIYVSEDGVTWQAKSLPVSGTWTSMTKTGAAILLLSYTNSVLIDDWSSFWCNFKGQSEIIA